MNSFDASPTPVAQRVGMAQLRRRAERLLKLLELSAPLPVIANECVNIHRAAVLGLGRHYFGSLGRDAVERARNDAELCETCDIPVKPGHDVCEPCRQRDEATFREIESESEQITREGDNNDEVWGG